MRKLRLSGLYAALCFTISFWALVAYIVLWNTWPDSRLFIPLGITFVVLQMVFASLLAWFWILCSSYDDFEELVGIRPPRNSHQAEKHLIFANMLVEALEAVRQNKENIDYQMKQIFDNDDPADAADNEIEYLRLDRKYTELEKKEKKMIRAAELFWLGDYIDPNPPTRSRWTVNSSVISFNPR